MRFSTLLIAIDLAILTAAEVNAVCCQHQSSTSKGCHCNVPSCQMGWKQVPHC